MKKNNNGISWSEALALYKRGFALWWKKYPQLFLINGFAKILDSINPYFTLYFSAQLINELAGAQEIEKLIKWVLLILGTTALVSMVRSVIGRIGNAYQAELWQYDSRIYSNKMLDMDFCDAEDSATMDKLSQIRQVENWSGQGLMEVYWIFSKGIYELFKVLGAIVLSVSLFTVPVPQQAGKLTVLNHPIFICVMFLVMLAVVFSTPKLTGMAGKWLVGLAEAGMAGNRWFSFFGGMAQERERALDIRIYRQDIYCRDNMCTFHIYDTKSPYAALSRGKGGLVLALSRAVSAMLHGLVYLYVCLKAWAGAFGVGSVTQYVGAVMAMADGIAGILNVMTRVKLNAPFMKKALDFLDIPHEMYKGSLTVEKRSDRNYEIEFRDVSFKYPHMETYALEHISLKFRIGERLAVVGQNGSGKTTFIKLLCRLYDPTEGEILLNGIDIWKYDYEEYMSMFSVVFQDYQLLAFSLGQNVAADMNYDTEQVNQALDKAGFHERRQTMPEGLETILYNDMEDKGVKISGGEAQKIAIARSLYHDAPFIILDEPTAALDPIAEYEIYTKFNEIVEDRTAIYISHRLSSCRFCDEIVVFHEGHMIEQGTHETLLEKGGKYCELWNAQAQYYV